MDAKFMKRYESFFKSLDALNEAKERDMSDSFVLSGTGAKFSITFDLSWKVMKDILVQHYAITDFVAGSPREVLRKAFQAEFTAFPAIQPVAHAHCRLYPPQIPSASSSSPVR